MGLVLRGLCAASGPGGWGGFGDAVGVISNRGGACEVGTQAGEQLTAQLGVVVTAGAGQGDAAGGCGARGRWLRLGGGSHGSARTQSGDTNAHGQTHRACTQAHGESMCRSAAGAGDQPGAKAHASRAARARPLPTGDLPAAPAFPGERRGKSRSAEPGR